jgi:hypothetical protein
VLAGDIVRLLIKNKQQEFCSSFLHISPYATTTTEVVYKTKTKVVAIETDTVTKTRKEGLTLTTDTATKTKEFTKTATTTGS